MAPFGRGSGRMEKQSLSAMGSAKRRLGLLKAGIAPGDRAVEKSDERFRSKESAGY